MRTIQQTILERSDQIPDFWISGFLSRWESDFKLFIILHNHILKLWCLSRWITLEKRLTLFTKYQMSNAMLSRETY